MARMSKYLFDIDPQTEWSGTPNNDEDRTATWDPTPHIITKEDMVGIIKRCKRWGCKIPSSTTTDITIEVPGLYAQWRGDRFPVDKMFIADINKLEVILYWPPSGHTDDDETENEPEEDKDNKVVPKKDVKNEVDSDGDSDVESTRKKSVNRKNLKRKNRTPDSDDLDVASTAPAPKRASNRKSQLPKVVKNEVNSDDDSDVVSNRKRSENRKNLKRKNPTPDSDDLDVASTAPAPKRASNRKSQLPKVVKNEVDPDDDSDVVSTRKKSVNRKSLKGKSRTPDNDLGVSSTAPAPKSASNRKSQLPKVVKKEVKKEVKVEVDNRTPEQKEIEELEAKFAYLSRELESLPNMRRHWQDMNELDGLDRILKVEESYKENVRQSIRYWIERPQQ